MCHEKQVFHRRYMDTEFTSPVNDDHPKGIGMEIAQGHQIAQDTIRLSNIERAKKRIDKMDNEGRLISLEKAIEILDKYIKNEEEKHEVIARLSLL